MTEYELLLHAKSYIDKLANGINPLTDEPVPETDLINNVRISRCLFFVANELKKNIEQNNKSLMPTKKKKPFELDQERRKSFLFSEKPIPISEIVNRLNGLVDLEKYKKLTYSQVTKWLIEIGALCEENIDGKTKKNLTEQSNEFGISTEQRQGSNGVYTVIVYNKIGQQFILDNLDAVLATHDNNSYGEYQGRPWSEEHQACLIELFQKQVPVSEIAITLQRSVEGIRARLKKLGLIEYRKDAL